MKSKSTSALVKVILFKWEEVLLAALFPVFEWRFWHFPIPFPSTCAIPTTLLHITFSDLAEFDTKSSNQGEGFHGEQ